MKVFKFGGASVKDASGVRNLTHIVKQQLTPGGLVVVVSAMGKTTNALEEVWRAFSQRQDYQAKLEQIVEYHRQIATQVLERNLLPALEDDFVKLHRYLQQTSPAVQSPDYHYDQIVSAGELFSTHIVAAALHQAELPALWYDVRELIRTDHTWREGRIDWDITREQIDDTLRPLLHHHVVVTQGFLGGTETNATTTLGREGSDFTGAILAGCLRAESLTIWKDVSGVLQADPKRLPDAALLDRISYRVASEMTYYGASVIHPKTIAPLKPAHIPLWVKSFVSPEAEGTCISEVSNGTALPLIMFKSPQWWLRIQLHRFHYLREEEIAQVLNICTELNLKVNLMTKTAFEVCLCTDDRPDKIEALRVELGRGFVVEIVGQCELLTVIHPEAQVWLDLLGEREIWVEIKSLDTWQAVLKG